jgi:hypothetical protein
MYKRGFTKREIKQQELLQELMWIEEELENDTSDDLLNKYFKIKDKYNKFKR